MSTLNDLKNTSETPLLSNENKYPKINNSNIQNNNTPNNNKVQNINKNNNLTPQNDNQYYSTLPTPKILFQILIQLMKLIMIKLNNHKIIYLLFNSKPIFFLHFIFLIFY